MDVCELSGEIHDPESGAWMTPPAYFNLLHQRLQARIPIWIIYYPTTTDFPGSWVLRLHVSLPRPMATMCAYVSDDLEAVRQHLPQGLYKMPPNPQDDPTIAEVWI